MCSNDVVFKSVIDFDFYILWLCVMFTLCITNLRNAVIDAENIIFTMDSTFSVFYLPMIMKML